MRSFLRLHSDRFRVNMDRKFYHHASFSNHPYVHFGPKCLTAYLSFANHQQMYCISFIRKHADILVRFRPIVRYFRHYFLVTFQSEDHFISKQFSFVTSPTKVVSTSKGMFYRGLTHLVPKSFPGIPDRDSPSPPQVSAC